MKDWDQLVHQQVGNLDTTDAIKATQDIAVAEEKRRRALAEYEKRLALYRQLGIDDKLRDILTQVWGGKGQIRENISATPYSNGHFVLYCDLVFAAPFSAPITVYTPTYIVENRGESSTFGGGTTNPWDRKI